MRLLLAIVLAVCLTVQGFAAESATAAKKRPVATKKATKAKPATTAAKPVATKPAGVKKTPVAKASASKSVKSTSAKSTRKAAASPPRRTVQLQPTTARYKEIQQALTDKGYFKGNADGTWGPESVEALKRFQHDQNLEQDGKIGSLSLIALGLGPQRMAAAEPHPPAQSQP